jgi:hypothetical protein
MPLAQLTPRNGVASPNQTGGRVQRPRCRAARTERFKKRDRIVWEAQAAIAIAVANMKRCLRVTAKT